MVYFLTIVVLISSMPAPMEGTTLTPATWPAQFISYTDKQNNSICDIAGEVSPSDTDITSGTNRGYGNLPSVYVASDVAGENLFVRYRMKTSPYDSKGGFLSTAWVVQIIKDVSGTPTQVATIGLDGKSPSVDYVYVANGDGTKIEKIYQTDATGFNVPGTRIVEDGNGHYFLDFQVPIPKINAIADAPVDGVDVKVMLYFGTSKAANLSVINKEWMSNDQSYTNIKEITLKNPIELQPKENITYPTITMDSLVGDKDVDGNFTSNIITVNGNVSENLPINFEINGSPLGTTITPTDGSWALQLSTHIPNTNGIYQLTAYIVKDGVTVKAMADFVVLSSIGDTLTINGGFIATTTVSNPLLSGTYLVSNNGNNINLTLNGTLLTGTATKDNATKNWSYQLAPGALNLGINNLKVEIKTNANPGVVMATTTQQLVYGQVADVVPLSVSIESIAPSGSATPLIGGISTNANTVEVQIDGKTIQIVQPVTDDTWSIEALEQPLMPGDHTIKAIAINATETEVAVTTETYTVSESSISIDNGSTVTINNNTPIIRGYTNAANTDAITITIKNSSDTTVYTIIVNPANGRWEVTVPPESNLDPDGIYTVSASVGAVTATQTLTIDTITTVAISAPTNNATTAEVRPTISGTAESGVSIDLQVSTNSGSIVIVQSLTASDGTWTYTPSFDLNYEQYNITAKAVDLYGNEGEASSVFTIGAEPTISPTATTFDKNSTDTSAGHYQDVSVSMTLYGKTLSSIKNGATTLTAGTGYTVSGSTVTMKKEYLATLGVGVENLTFTFSDSSTKNLAVTVSDTTEPTISPTTATFDKNTADTRAGHYQDVVVTMTLNEKTLSSIKNGDTILTLGTHYTVDGGTVTFKKEYLDDQGVGTTNLTFSFSDSSTKTLAVTVSNSTPSGDSGGDSSYTPPASNTIKGDVIDGLTGQSVKGIEANVVDGANGTKSIGFNSHEAILFKKADDTNSPWSDLSTLSFSSNLASNPDGTSQPSITKNADGTIEVQNLTNGSQAIFEVTIDLGNGQKIVIGKINVQVSANGDISLTSTLIDPYGIITDVVTGEEIEGAYVILYYADTERNLNTGKTPNTQVNLPILPAFEPNDNKNPQYSNIEGSYAFMVFPNTDYYVVATREGYYDYISPTLTVELEIVKWDFRMNPIPKTTPIVGVERLSGPSRIETAIEIAKATYPDKVKAVIMATAQTFPDALTGSVLAYKLQAPIILVGSSVSDQTKVLDYMKEYLDPTGKVYILGGTGAVSQEMGTKVQQAGYSTIKRLGGEDRYHTALKIFDELDLKPNTPVFLASGENYPDALSISSIAAINQFPILLARKSGLIEEVKNKIRDIEPGKVFIIGLEGALSSNLEMQVAQVTVIDSFNIIRIGGRDRYQTSVAVAKYFELAGNDATVGTGESFPDVLAGSVYAAKYNAPILLVNKTLSDETKEYLRERKVTGIKIFGGESAVPRAILEDLSKLIFF